MRQSQTMITLGELMKLAWTYMKYNWVGDTRSWILLISKQGSVESTLQNVCCILVNIRQDRIVTLADKWHYNHAYAPLTYYWPMTLQPCLCSTDILLTNDITGMPMLYWHIIDQWHYSHVYAPLTYYWPMTLQLCLCSTDILLTNDITAVSVFH